MAVESARQRELEARKERAAVPLRGYSNIEKVKSHLARAVVEVLIEGFGSMRQTESWQEEQQS